MALSHVVDTSVLTRLKDPVVRAVVEPLATAGHLATAGVSDLEVGYSARNTQEWDDLALALGVFGRIETTDLHLVRARQVQRSLASISQRGHKIPDLLVAAAAEEAGLTVLHYDTDFDLIASVTGQSVEWAVPAGSVD